MREIFPDSTALSPIDTSGHENGLFFLEHSVVVKDLLSKIACAGPPERFSMTAVTVDCDEKSVVD